MVINTYTTHTWSRGMRGDESSLAKEPYIQSKEPHIQSKETYIQSKGPCILSNKHIQSVW